MPQSDKKVNTGYDFNGIVTKGYKPEKGSVVITGNTKDMADGMRRILSDGIDIHHFPSRKVLAANPDRHDQIVAAFKARKIKELGVGTFWESSMVQAKMIRELSPETKVIVPREKTVLFVTNEWLTPDLALRIKNEGHNVLLAAKSKTSILKGTIKRVPYEERLTFARAADLVVYEDKSNNGEASMLRKEGVSVIGGDKLTDKLELDRKWSNEIAKSCGIKVPEMVEVVDLADAKRVITERPARWVLKQEGKLDGIKGLNFVAKLPDSKDLLDYIDILESRWITGVEQTFVLQEFVDGYEVAVGSYWNGHEFMKDKDGDEICEINWEHKALFPGNLGESTGEQYTVMQYVKAKHCKLFMETLDKSRELLKKLDFRGDFDINTKVTETGAHFLEYTPRMGVPATCAQIEIHKSSWYNFLKAMADGEQDRNFEYDGRYTIVSWLYTKPFPFVNSHVMTKVYEEQFADQSPTDIVKIGELMSFRLSDSMGLVVNFTKDFTKDDLSHVHMDGTMMEDGVLKVGNADGYVVTVSEQGKTVEEAGEKVEAILKKIIVPRAFWRNDFGRTNFHKSKDDLEAWDYILSDEEKTKRYEELQKQKAEEMNAKAQETNEQRRLGVRDRLKRIIFNK